MGTSEAPELIPDTEEDQAQGPSAIAGENDFHRIYELWHEFAANRRVDELLNLYAEKAILESPLVPIILNQESGILKGRAEIHHFLQEGTRRRPNDLVRWYRTGQYFCSGNTLIWEYPRETPNGDQIDILELMEINAGKIDHHRIYWGWFGVNLLLRNSMK